MLKREGSFLSALLVRDGQLSMPLGTLRIEHPLNQGQLSEAYLAYHPGLDVPVVIRVMKPVIREQLGTKAYQDLVRCLQHYARIRHPSITGIYDVGIFKEHAYAVSEFVSGIPLSERIKDRPLEECDALKLMSPISEGLAALWRNDYVHRGVSPLRVLIDSEGVSKLDLAVLPRTALHPLVIEAHAPFMAGYWPPEELKQSAGIDSRSDMFSFAASLYYALTGVSPFGKGSRTELIARTMTEEPVNPRTLVPDLRPSLVDFLMRCLQRRQQDRFESTQQFMDTLDHIRSEICRPSTVRPSSFTPVAIPGDTLRAPATLRAGEMVGQCRLEEMVGAGAFGVVFKARHQLLDIPVAVKFLPAELAARNPEYVDLFLREARTAIRIRHKHIIGLYEAGNQNGQYYLIMEFASGGSVQDRLEAAGGKLPVELVVKVIRETALGLGAAEEMGIVHRDIKPANLMFGSQQEIKIADLGLAKRLARPTPEGAVKHSIQAEQLTQLSGQKYMQGTPAYMAPEMALTPDSVDGRSDLYALGVTAFQLLAGRLPFDGNDSFQVLMQHATQPVPALRKLNPEVPAKLEEIIEQLMEKSPEERFQNAQELIKALE